MNPQERNHVGHFIFPGIFVAKSAKGKTSTALTYVANQMCRSPSKYGDLSAQVDSISPRFVPNTGTLSSSDPCNAATSQLTSRQNVGRGRFDHSAGSRNAGTQYNPRAANVIRFPSLSRPVSPLEVSNSLQTSIDIGVAMFWIGYFLLIFCGLGFSCWALLRAIHLL
jgi:hypothetical protein